MALPIRLIGITDSHNPLCTLNFVRAILEGVRFSLKDTFSIFGKK